jgi:hypothetical protein
MGELKEGQMVKMEAEKRKYNRTDRKKRGSKLCNITGPKRIEKGASSGRFRHIFGMLYMYIKTEKLAPLSHVHGSIHPQHPPSAISVS